MHFTRPNTTPHTRVSLDFRVVPGPYHDSPYPYPKPYPCTYSHAKPKPKPKPKPMPKPKPKPEPKPKPNPAQMLKLEGGPPGARLAAALKEASVC